MERPTKPKLSTWKRSEMTPAELALLREYERKLKALRRQDPEYRAKCRESSLRCYQKHRERRVKESSEWRKRNWEAVYTQRKLSPKTREIQNRWYHNTGKFNIQYYTAEKWRAATRRALFKKSELSNELIEVLGCNQEQFRIWMETNFKEGMSFENYGKWEIDHVKPCNQFDLSEEGQVKACFHYSNTQSIWAKDHIEKSKIDRLS